MHKKGQLGLLQTAVITFLVIGIIGGLAVTMNAKMSDTVARFTAGTLYNASENYETNPGDHGNLDGSNVSDRSMGVDAVNFSIVGTKDLLSFQSILALVIVGVIVLGLIGLFNRR